MGRSDALAAPGSPSAPRVDGRRIGFVVADFHAEIADAMLHVAKARAAQLGAVPGPELRVGGSYDLPLAAARLLRRPDVDAVVAIGAIVQGETAHDEVIAHAAATALQTVALSLDKPVGLAVTGPRMTMDQAKARIDAGARAVDAVARLLQPDARLDRKPG
ncbi:MAG TPA: 6,7-dimethyl-8-ribityllumazine synthase [Candidatus Thermoplasmatota archaeon]|nr:6,7-dimethyl-8-ribityllumazine synthase [Candidatus Thermoplasmatota archaeon]